MSKLLWPRETSEGPHCLDTYSVSSRTVRTEGLDNRHSHFHPSGWVTITLKFLIRDTCMTWALVV